MDVAGSGKITDGADNVFSVWRAQKDESKPDDGAPDAKLFLKKQRNGEYQNFTQVLWFDKGSQQYRTQQSRLRSFSFVPFSKEPSYAHEAE